MVGLVLVGFVAGTYFYTIGKMKKQVGAALRSGSETLIYLSRVRVVLVGDGLEGVDFSRQVPLSIYC